MLPRETVPLGRGGVLPIATGRLCGNVFVERLLHLPRAVVADGFGTANGRVVEEYFLFWMVIGEDLFFGMQDARRCVAETEQKSAPNRTDSFGFLC